MRGINMSYCAIENTSMAMAQVLELLQEHIDEGGSIQSYLEKSTAAERRSWGRLVGLANAILDLAEEEEIA